MPTDGLGAMSWLRFPIPALGWIARRLDAFSNRFFTTKEMGRGTGLGLATVYGVVKQHGGFIYAYSEPGSGTIFRLYFPAAAGALEPPEVKREDESQKDSGTILLADDHEGLRESAREMLEGLGYRVISANNGMEAVKLFQENTDQIDLVILDVVMPSLSGPDAYSQISAIRPGTKAIFTSGYSAETASLKLAVEKGTPILQKPYSMRSLSQTLRNALDSVSSAQSDSAKYINC